MCQDFKENSGAKGLTSTYDGGESTYAGLGEFKEPTELWQQLDRKSVVLRLSERFEAETPFYSGRQPLTSLSSTSVSNIHEIIRLF